MITEIPTNEQDALFMGLNEIRDELYDWQIKNFGVDGKTDPMNALLGVQEEYGELCHAVLKGRQNIRGTREKHIEDEKDALADILIYLMNFTSELGLRFDDPKVWRGVYHLVYKSFKNRNVSEDQFDRIQDIASMTNMIFSQYMLERKTKGELRAQFLAEDEEERLDVNKMCYYAIHLIVRLHQYAVYRGFNLPYIFSNTFERIVKKRDWVRFPNNGVDL